MGSCNTCKDIENAYKNSYQSYLFDPLRHSQCVDLYKDDNAASCYGAPYFKRCTECKDVVNAYYNKSWRQNPRDFVQCQNILNGSYTGSCRNTNINNNILSSSCANGRGNWINSSVDLRYCNGGIANIFGNLRC